MPTAMLNWVDRPDRIHSFSACADARALPTKKVPMLYTDMDRPLPKPHVGGNER